MEGNGCKEENGEAGRVGGGRNPLPTKPHYGK